LNLYGLKRCASKNATCRLLTIIGLFYKRALQKRRYSAKETYNLGCASKNAKSCASKNANAVVRYNKKAGKSVLKATKCIVAENPHNLGRHRTKIGPKPKVLAYSKSP